jgi:hypothetical protein
MLAEEFDPAGHPPRCVGVRVPHDRCLAGGFSR